jgi:hypothetical protein
MQTMNDSQWDAKLKSFLKKTGDDFKRFGNDVKVEAEKLMKEVQDPARQEKLRDGLKDVGVWAKKTAEEVATLVETGVKKAEESLVKAGDKVNEFVAKPLEKAAGAETAAPAPTPPSPPPAMDEPPKKAKKTVGKAGGAKKKPSAAGKKTATKKTIGKE